mmetsp:Transcript_10834/g.24567  ORF Transcript_10834/g.24567 Transcript_10834/m.24567 type:complete len:634 (+) Transcript_10834:4457-6358(+)
MRGVDGQDHVQIALHSVQEECVGRAVLVALRAEFFLEWREQRVELVGREHPGDLARRQQGVDALQERRVAELEVLQHQRRRLSLHAREHHGALQIGEKVLHCVVATDFGRRYLHPMHVAGQGRTRASADTAATNQEQAAAGLGQHALHARNPLQNLREEKNVEVFALAGVLCQGLGHAGAPVGHRQLAQRPRHARQGLCGSGRKGGVHVVALRVELPLQAEDGVDRRVKPRHGVGAHEPISEHALRLIRDGTEKVDGADVVAEQAHNPLRDVARGEEVVPVVVDSEDMLDLLEDVQEGGGELLDVGAVAPRGMLGQPRADCPREVGSEYLLQLLLGGVGDTGDAGDGGEAGRESVPPNSRRRVHGTNELNAFDAHPLQTLVETAVRDKLLQEGNQLDCVVLVRLGQVEVLEVQNQPLAALGPVHTPRGGREQRAALRQLLDHVRGRGLRAAVDRGDVGAPHLGEGVAEEQRLACALGAHQEEGLASIQPLREQRGVFLQVDGHHHGQVALRRRGDDKVGRLQGHREIGGVPLERLGVLVVVRLQRLSGVDGPLASKLEYFLRKLCARIQVQIGAEPVDQSNNKLLLGLHPHEVRQRTVHNPNPCRVHDKRVVPECELHRRLEQLVCPGLQLDL